MNRDTRRARLVLAFLLLVSFTLLTVDYRTNDRSPLRPVEKAVAAIVGPGERAVSGAVRPVTNAVHFGNPASDLAALRKQNEQLTRQLEDTQDDHRKAEELDRLLGYATYFTIKPARVVAWGGDAGFDRTVTIDIGQADGVRPDMTVVTGLGLVGKVVRVDGDTSTVALISDPNIAVGVRLARTGDFGKVQGRPDGQLELTIVKQNAAIKVGDTFVTLGSVKYVPYVPDVPIGHVVAVDHAPGQLSAQAVVQPYVDLTTLDLVGVVFPPPRQPARDALIPTASPTSPTSPSASPASAGLSGSPSRSPSPTPTGTP
jgi:rod shape-determining protein MreC